MALGTYDANGIWHYGESENIAPFSATLNKLADSASSAITADRSRISTLEAGSLSGLIPIKPPTVAISTGTGATNDLGVVTFTGATAVSLNNIFTTNFRNYRCLINITSSTGTGGSVGIRLRSAGVDRNGSDYGTSGIQMTTGGANSAYNAVTTFFDSGYLYISASSYNALTLEIRDPQVAIKTKLQCAQNGVNSAGVISSWLTNCLHDQAQSHDGITILPTGAATITGTIQVFGYND